jgi:phospholipid/cholesterol/gamma-HCH transport system substrate-binding protein
METRSNHMLVGGVVLGLLAALIVFIVWMSQVTAEGQRQYDIFFQQSVDGLARGAAVSFSGVPVGQVESINLMPDNPEFVRVRIQVRETTPILQGTTATIQGVGFTGVSQIQLDGATRGAPPIECPEDNAQACPFGVPVIPTKPGALGQLLNTAPELLERVSTLAERLSELLGDRNQASIARILENTDVMTRELANRSPEIAATLAEARVAIRQAGEAADRIGELAGSTQQLVDRDGRPLVNDLRHTLRSAEQSMENLNAAIGDARPGIQAFSQQTLPEVGQLVRDLRETSESLRSVTERLDQQGVGGIIGGQRLPDYRPERRR